jgi:hypothetical protein
MERYGSCRGIRVGCKDKILEGRRVITVGCLKEITRDLDEKNEG